jgi:hypothetical protein
MCHWHVWHIPEAVGSEIYTEKRLYVLKLSWFPSVLLGSYWNKILVTTATASFLILANSLVTYRPNVRPCTTYSLSY